MSAFDLLTDPFQLELMQRALVAGLLTAVATALVGTWVVLRGLAFMGDALAHGVIPGIAIAFLLDISLILGAFAAALFMIGAISLIHRTTRLQEDTAIGLLFVGMLALGVIIISRSGSFAVDIVAILFGDVLGTTGRDLVVAVVLSLFVAAVVFAFYRPLLVLSFNEEKAAVLGMRPRWAHLVMLGLITLAVVASFQTVGALLVFGLLIAPPATASLITRQVPVMMGVACLLGMAAVVLGLVLSFHLDTAGGATISFLAVLLFFAVLALRRLAGRRRRPLATLQVG